MYLQDGMEWASLLVKQAPDADSAASGSSSGGVAAAGRKLLTRAAASSPAVAQQHAIANQVLDVIGPNFGVSV